MRFVKYILWSMNKAGIVLTVFSLVQFSKVKTTANLKIRIAFRAIFFGVIRHFLVSISLVIPKLGSH